MSDATPPPPPAYEGPPTSPPFVATPVYKRVGGLAKAMSVLLVVFAISTALGSVFSATSRSDARDYIGDNITEQDFLDAIAPSVLFDLVGGIITIALAVLTMIWMYRLAANQRDMGRRGRWAPGWAIGGWFLPPVLYIIPLLMLRELWKGADPTPPRAGSQWRSAPDGGLVWVWWVFFGLVPVILIPLGVSVFTDFGNETIDLARMIDERYTYTLVSNIGGIVSAVAYLFLVRRLTTRQQVLTGSG